MRVFSAVLWRGSLFGLIALGLGGCEQDLDAAFDASEFFFVGSAGEHVAGAAQEIGDLGLGIGAGRAFGEAFGMGAFEEPGGGLPVAAGEVMEHVDGGDLGLDGGLPQPFVKFRISACFVADRDDAATSVLLDTTIGVGLSQLSGDRIAGLESYGDHLARADLSH